MANELLFKLKKGGKCVGYMRVAASHGGMVEVRQVQYDNELGAWHFFYSQDGCHLVSFDSIHPFVCKDRHGQDVFAGDRIRATSVTHAPPDTGNVKWDADELQWWFECVRATWPLAESLDSIELVPAPAEGEKT